MSKYNEDKYLFTDEDGIGAWVELKQGSVRLYCEQGAMCSGLDMTRKQTLRLTFALIKACVGR